MLNRFRRQRVWRAQTEDYLRSVDGIARPSWIVPNSYAPTSYSQAVLMDAPVSYWRFGETLGTVAKDSIGTNNGVISGDLTLGTGGAIGDGSPAYQFGGTNALVTIPSATNLQIVGGLTIEFWARIPSIAVRPTVITKDSTKEFEVTIETNGIVHMYRGNDGGTANGLTAGDFPTGQWNHVVVANADRQTRYYVNGAFKGTSTYTAFPVSSTNNIIVGSNFAGTQRVTGSIAHVAIYNYALGADRVAVHYALKK